MDGLKHFRAQAIIFDKDGTLIDFDAMWGGWAIYLADQLKSVSGVEARAALCLAMGYDELNGKVLTNGKLAASTMGHLYQVTIEVMASLGLSAAEAERVVAEAWYIPNPLLLTKPFTDTRALFSSLQALGIQIGIATADNREPTQSMLEALDVEEFVTTMVCADDGIPSKPAPDMALTICARLNVDPQKTMLIGDTASDLKMARAAGIGLVVGVLSGVSAAKDLIPYADVLIESVDELHAYAEALANANAAYKQTGLDPDFAF